MFQVLFLRKPFQIKVQKMLKSKPLLQLRLVLHSLRVLWLNIVGVVYFMVQCFSVLGSCRE